MADFASIAPRSHDPVPSLLPQPKLNVGVSLAGAAVSRTVESGTFPPVVQALMIHWAGCPRLLLDAVRVTSTQSRTRTVGGGFFAGVRAVVLGVGEAPGLDFEVLGVGVRVGVTELISGADCSMTPPPPPPPPRPKLAPEVTLVFTLGDGEGDGEREGDGDGDGLEVVGVGVGVGVSEGDGLGVGVGSLSGSHDV